MVVDELVSVVVLNYNGAHFLADCISSIAEQDYSDLEIIFVDNGSKDNSIEIASSYDVKILSLNENKGFSNANNEASKATRAPFIFFVNYDMKFEKNCISELVKEISSDPTIFAVDPLQYNWEGSKIVHGGTAIKKSGLKNPIPFIEVNYTEYVDKKIEVPWGCAGSLLVRKSMFDLLGGFDSTFFLDNEDLDLCWRAWMRGWRTVYLPDAKLYHKISGGMTTVPEGRILSGERNLMRFVIKVMSKKFISKFFAAKLLQCIGLLFIGRFMRSRVILKATAHTLYNLELILKERKEIFSESKISSDMLLKKFLF